jgi:dephospho-CoA kinase
MNNFKNAIALTGSIATGKSTVAKILSFNGFSIIDCDEIAHKVLNENTNNITKMFGDYLLIQNKNQINRKKLGKLIFDNPSNKKKLENLLHPLIYEQVKKQSNIYEVSNKKYIIDIALFFESDKYKEIKEVIVVYASKDLQLQRLIDRDGFSKKDALLRINSQIDIEIKKKKATYIVDNCYNIIQTTKQTNDLSDTILCNN